MALLLEALNDVYVLGVYIQGDYLNIPHKDKVWTGLENNLVPLRDFLLLFSDTLIVWQVQVLRGERNLHRQYHIMDFHLILLIQMCECRIKWSQMVSSIDHLYWYTHMLWWWSQTDILQSSKVYLRYISWRKLPRIKILTMVQGGILVQMLLSLTYQREVVLHGLCRDKTVPRRLWIQFQKR